MAADSFAGRLREMKELLGGADPTRQDFLVAPDPDSVFLPGSLAPVLGSTLVEHRSGLLIPSTAAVTPQPIDQVIT